MQGELELKVKEKDSEFMYYLLLTLQEKWKVSDYCLTEPYVDDSGDRPPDAVCRKLQDNSWKRKKLQDFRR